MKKIYIICLVVLLLTVLTGCNNNNNNNNNKFTYSTSQINYQNNNIITKQVLSSFSTKIYDKNSNRINNLKLAIEKINKITIKKGETFSFNTIAGPYSEEKGYLEAKIMTDGGKTDENFGGGVCQISSTLYNAVLPLGVEIVERHGHPAKVPYVEKGKDATVSCSNDLDFKFKNTTEDSLSFECNILNENNEIKIDVIGFKE